MNEKINNKGFKKITDENRNNLDENLLKQGSRSGEFWVPSSNGNLVEFEYPTTDPNNTRIYIHSRVTYTIDGVDKVIEIEIPISSLRRRGVDTYRDLVGLDPMSLTFDILQPGMSDIDRAFYLANKKARARVIEGTRYIRSFKTNDGQWTVEYEKDSDGNRKTEPIKYIVLDRTEDPEPNEE